MNELRNLILLFCCILIMQGCGSPKPTENQNVKNTIVQENEHEGTSEMGELMFPTKSAITLIIRTAAAKTSKVIVPMPV